MFYVDAFKELSTTRQYSMSAGPIPFTAIMDYAILFEVEDKTDFLYIIRCMDLAWMEAVDEQKSDKENSDKS